MMTRLMLLAPFVLASCGMVPDSLKPEPGAGMPAATAAMPEGATPPGTGAAEVPAGDLPGAGTIAPARGSLGRTVASLGAPGEAGLWLKTPLVKAETPGRITYQGKSADVTLIPIPGEPGAGSRISLSAMQAIGAPLTGLPTLEVAAR